ncbi:hypothetical protein N7507_011759, partial [Penicillium longicatenatum]
YYSIPLYLRNIYPLYPLYNLLYIGGIKEHREDLRISSISLNANILKALVEECREKYLRDT